MSEEHIKAELLEELSMLRARVAELEQAERDLKQQKESLQESEKKYRKLFDSSPDGVIIVALDGKILDANQAYQDMLGYTLEELKDMKYQQLTPEKWREVEVEAYESRLKKGHVGYEKEYIRKDGTIFPVFVSGWLIKDKQGNPEKLGAFVKDITERKKAEEALGAERQRLYSLLDELPAFVYLQAPDYSVPFANRYFREHFGDPEGKRCYEVLWRAKEPCKRCPTFKVFETNKPQVWEWCQSPDGRIYEINDYSFSDVDGSPLVLELGIDITERKKAEQALRESQSWKRAILDSIPDMAWIKDKDSRYIAANEPLCKAFGMKLEDLVGKTDFDISPEDLAKRYRADDQEVMKSGKRKRVEEPWGKKKGKRRWIETIKTPIYNDEGQVIGTSGIARDITKHKRIVDALQANECFLQDIFDAIQDGVSVLDRDLNIIKVNPWMEKMYAERMPLVGKKCYIAYQKRKSVCPWCPSVRAIETGQTQTNNVPYPCADKPTGWIELSAFPLKDADGRVTGVIEHVKDITERKKAEEQLKESEQRFRAIFDSAADGMILADVETKKFYTGNKVICQMLGYNPEELKNLGVVDIHSREDLPHVIEQFEKQARGRFTLSKDIPVKRKNGGVFYADINAVPITLAGRKYLMGIFRDVTELKQAQEELDIYREQMAQAEQLASLGTLSATVAHELTQPLTVISLAIENSLAELEKMSCPGTVMENLKEGLDDVSHATSIVDRFRNFARRSSDKTSSEIELKAVAERIFKLLNESARRAKVTLSLKDMDKLPPLYSHPKDLEQLFFALVDNAIRAADGKNSSQLAISGAVRDEHIELQFADTCSGIAPENLDRIFEPFFTTNSANGGTGLGLCIVQRIVSRAGGKVRVESKVGKGSTFFVTLPINNGRRFQLSSNGK